MKAIHRLDAKTLHKLAAGKEYTDGGGLSLAKTTETDGNWIFTYHFEGKKKRRGLGSLLGLALGSEKTSIEQARDKANTKRGLLRAGKDPFPDADAIAAKPLFLPFAREVMNTVCATYGEKTKAKWMLSIESYAKPLHDMPLDAPTVDDIETLLKPIWIKKACTARELRRRLERIFAAAGVKGFRARGDNPAVLRNNLDIILGKQPAYQRGPHPMMPFIEVPDFVTKLYASPYQSAKALLVYIYTAMRSENIEAMRWSELDLDKKFVWTIPGPQMKNRIEAKVPLCKPVLALLRQMRAERIEGEDYVFPGEEPGTHISDGTMLNFLQRHMGRDDCTVHGFRSSFRTWGQDETEYQDQVLEFCIHHIEGSKAKKAYMRGAMLERRRIVMEAWAAYVMSGKPALRAVA